MPHASVEQLIATTAACVCGFCIPSGIPKHCFSPMKQAQNETTCIFSIGVYLGSPGLSFFEILAFIFFSFL